uniref:Uncharacterized protein n=1 Tax=Arundo donax TaxID=35708 RepID=A0A0A8YM70_ARUDO
MYLNRSNGTAKARIVLDGAKFQFPELIIEAEPWSLTIQEIFAGPSLSTAFIPQHDLIFSWSPTTFIHCQMARAELVTVTSSKSGRYGEGSNRGARGCGGGGGSRLRSSSSAERFTTDTRLFSSSLCETATLGGTMGFVLRRSALVGVCCCC